MRLRTVLSALVALCCLLFSFSASAQATRTWVSGVGDDVNPCSRTAPCKTFAGAISKTATGGVISALDPGGYGAVTITKAITIDGRGTQASILNSLSTGVIVNAPADAVVVLRGLSLHGGGTGTFGIRFLAGKALHVEDTVIQANAGPAIQFLPAVASSLFLKRVVASGNSGGLLLGGTSTATLSRCDFTGNVLGVHAAGDSRVTIHDSIVASHTDKGLFAEGTSEINMDHGLIAGNGIGVQGDAPVRLSEVMVSHNVVGLAGARVISFGNNRVAAGNGTNGAPNETLPQQ